LKGQYVRGDHGKPIVILEAVASQHLWIWHTFFGVFGSNNVIDAYTVLLYMFLMMFFSLVYRFDNCLMFSFMSCEKVSLFIFWHVESIHHTLNRISKSLTSDASIHNSLNRITYESILFSLNPFTKLSNLH